MGVKCSSSNRLSHPPRALIGSASHTLNTHVVPELHTCEVCQAELSKAVWTLFLVVDHHSQGVVAIVQSGASDDAEVVQRDAAELVDSKQNVARHFLNRLNTNKENKYTGAW